jgi:hypothetical protein
LVCFWGDVREEWGEKLLLSLLFNFLAICIAIASFKINAKKIYQRKWFGWLGINFEPH